MDPDARVTTIALLIRLYARGEPKITNTLNKQPLLVGHKINMQGSTLKTL